LRAGAALGGTEAGLVGAAEARADPGREATTVVIGVHPFVIGTPDGAAAMRRVLARLKQDDKVWLTNTDAILQAAGLK
jgi:allantoinase